MWCALKTESPARFFRLLRQASFLQACLMFRYVGQMRTAALRQMMRGFKGAAGEARYPLDALVRLLMFEGGDDAVAFLDHCGLEIAVAHGDGDGDGGGEGPYVVLASAAAPHRDLADMLPVDKNGHPIPPTVRPLPRGIEAKRLARGLSIADVCRGLASAEAAAAGHAPAPFVPPAVAPVEPPRPRHRTTFVPPRGGS